MKNVVSIVISVIAIVTAGCASTESINAINGVRLDCWCEIKWDSSESDPIDLRHLFYSIAGSHARKLYIRVTACSALIIAITTMINATNP